MEHLEYIFGEGNDTPLQYCCLENPMDGESWWAAVHGVATSQTQLNNYIRKSPLKYIIYLKRKSKIIKTFIRKHKRKSSRQAKFPEIGQHKVPSEKHNDKL